MAEYKQLLHNPPDGVIAGPVNQDNFFEWEAAITGPEGSPFEDGVFVTRLVFPQDYPLNPPSMRFISKIFHPNIYPDGKVCISILHPPGDDPTGYEKSSERWSPVQSVEKVHTAKFNPIKKIYTLRKIDKCVLKLENKGLTQTVCHNIRTPAP